MRHRELTQTRHTPAQEFIAVSFGNHRNLIAVIAQETVGFHACTGQHVSADIPQFRPVVRRAQFFGRNNPADRSPGNYTKELRMSHLGTSECNYFGIVGPTGAEKASDHRHLLHPDRPNQLTFIDRVYMVDLHADITRRMRP